MDSPARLTSRQKAVGMLAQLDEIEPDGVDPAMQAALTMATMARPQIMGLLPEDPVELDELLLLGAHWLLNLRSDDAATFGIHAATAAAAVGEPAE